MLRYVKSEILRGDWGQELKQERQKSGRWHGLSPVTDKNYHGQFVNLSNCSLSLTFNFSLKRNKLFKDKWNNGKNSTR